jgi:Asp-tRNA(Asn)/Glu-tRNA(Gln) amidotransferase C subunit
VELPKGGGVEVNAEDLHNVWREDNEEPREFSKELIIGQFPDAMEGFLKVKKIL